MSVVYNTTLKNTRMTDVVNAINTGGAGYIEIGTAGLGVVLATINFQNPCGTVSGGVLTFSGTPLTVASAANTGIAASAAVFSGSGVLIVSGLTVGTTGTDVILSSVNVISGQPVTISSASITHG